MMACLGSGRRCIRGLEKLCLLGQNTQIKRKSVAYIRIKEIGIQPHARTFVQNCLSECTYLNAECTATACPLLCKRISASSQTTDSPSSTKRHYSTELPDYQTVDPYVLLEDDLKYIFRDIRQELRWNTNQDELHTIATYYFDGQGKAVRPMVAILMARAINYHLNKDGLSESQRQVAMIFEMIHSASLIHDDVIDQSELRRGKPSVNVLFNHKKVAMAGDFILAVASMMIARLRDNDVTLTLSQIMTDLIQGEFMQLGAKETENERFAHYLTKTYRKTASLIANGLKAEAMLAGADPKLSEIAFEYGRNVGIAFQLVDDMLDFISSSDAMGKPTAADLKLGLATAPVLFACEKFPELNPMIMRRFQEPGDVEKAFELVHKSQGLEQTRFLAKKHCVEAARLANIITESPYQKGVDLEALRVVSHL
nr:decaprenyl-diphosphate synthase [Kerria lacca]